MQKMFAGFAQIRIAACCVVALVCCNSVALAQLEPPTNFEAVDLDNDDGSGIQLRWELSADDTDDAATRKVIKYEIRRKVVEGEKPTDDFVKIDEATYQVTETKDKNCALGEKYLYQIVAIGAGGVESAVVSTAEPVSTMMQYFDATKLWFGIMMAVICGAIILFILMAKAGRELKIRKIAGLEAVDEAVGRATEMGKSIMYVPGIVDINDMQTIAGLTVLSRVAGKAAEYGARIEVPTSRSLVMTAAQETVESAYIGAGRQDAYNQDDIYYLTDEQFGYVAGVTGTMVRDEPAACFYMGCFYAESLILAETGNAIGAIQVAGTAMPSQLPFFVAACDYTLIGEEFFAAAAYLSGEKQQLASLKGQDVGKLIVGLMILVGSGMATLLTFSPESPAAGWLDYLTNTILQ